MEITKVKNADSGLSRRMITFSSEDCLFKSHGVSVNADIFQNDDHVVLNFANVHRISPAFFDGLFENTPISQFKNVNLRKLDDFGSKILFWVMDKHYNHSVQDASIYRAYRTKAGELYPILYMDNGIVTVMALSGKTEWLEHNGVILPICEMEYEKLLSEKTAAYLEMRKHQSQRSQQLQCPECRKSFQGSINSYRKHIHSCKGNL